MHTFASPIIILFLGGFFLAMAATKYRLDQNLARVLLTPFGQNPKHVMLGVMIITALFSMFMSNTATTAMMLSILTPVLALMEGNDKGKIGLLLSVPLAANIGGIGTPIGTPPNAVALKYLSGQNHIGFGEWMSFAVPFVIILMAIAWLTLILTYPAGTKSIKLEVKGRFLKTNKAYVVYSVFIITILLWLTDFVHGMNAYVVSMIPVTIFSMTGIITKSDLQKISWDVLWLVSGGIALGFALDQSGLAARVIGSINFEKFFSASDRTRIFINRGSHGQFYVKYCYSQSLTSFNGSNRNLSEFINTIWWKPDDCFGHNYCLLNGYGASN